jgi:hypothetical protein
MATAEIAHEMSQNQDVNNDVILDGYGRDASERTVELDSYVAEAVNRVVDGAKFDDCFANIKAQAEGGRPKTYDEALTFIVYRGLAEIKRSQDAQAKVKLGASLREQQSVLKSMLALKPDLVNDAEFAKKVMAAFKLS